MAKIKISKESAEQQKKNVDFNELFREYFKPLCAYCQYKFGLDIDEAKDTVHSGFINLLESDFIFSSKLSARAYLYKIVTNICIDLARHKKVKQHHVLHIQQKMPESKFEMDYNGVEFKELENDIKKVIAEMPEKMREVFLLSRDNKFKNAEIAQKKGISIKTVETQMSRSLALLRLKLASYLGVF
jgi:RNA polymerase sigma-70 factor (ECF subfamily)